MSRAAPNVSTIPAGRPFARTLARTLLDQYRDNEAELSRTLILLPTRRACRILQEAFLNERKDAPLVLPRMQPIGDLDEEELALSLLGQGAEDLAQSLKPALSPMRRQILLSKYVRAQNADYSPDQCLGLAQALGQLMDQIYTENLDFKNIASLVPAEFASHWQITLEFLEILSATWPAVLAEEGRIDQADRRNRLILALCDHWQSHPPAYRIIAAGSTGSIPAVAKLLSVVAHLPQGEVILPGLDQVMDDESWNTLDETHPQYNLKLLLRLMGDLPRDQVRPWTQEQNPRHLLAAELMRPPATVNAWRTLSKDEAKRKMLQQSLENLKLITCAHEREEAEVIALLLRETLETLGKSACLITPDRTLAARVKEACRRWDLILDDSAGNTFDKTPLGAFIMLAFEAAFEGFSPVALMALLKHYFVQLGHTRNEIALIRENLDFALRGPKPAYGFAALRAHIDQNPKLRPAEKTQLNEFLQKLETPYAPLLEIIKSKNISAENLLRTGLSVCEKLATTNERAGAQILWSGPIGLAASSFFADLLSTLTEMPELSSSHIGVDFKNILLHFMKQLSIRPSYGTHPRLHIFGQLEARLVDADLVIMSGLNEGTWPPDSATDPWMSRPMRKEFGLPSPERSIGLAAHDFVQGLSMNEVVITRAQRKDSSPTVPARWLLRLEAVLEAANLSLNHMHSAELLHWARTLDASEMRNITERPEPKPPINKRPREISLTDVETWLKDPYSIYAKYILKLRKLDALEENLDAAERGSILHKILERFVNETRDAYPENAQQKLLTIAAQELETRQDNEAIWSFWWPRFIRIAVWLENHERNWREAASILAIEAKGKLTLSTGAGPFTINGRADRIDKTLIGGGAIIDYKSSGSFTKKSIENGDKPQLAIEALMLQNAGFEAIGALKPASLQYWICNGSGEGAKTVIVNERLDEILNETEKGLRTLIESFEKEETPYASLPIAGIAPAYNDYEHLARVREWSMEGEQTEEFAGEAE
jgi:ATP-dependent helicase/nuclease subunit B